MRKMLISAAIATLCAAALPAAAAPASQESQNGAQSSRPPQEPRAADPNRRVCVADRLSDSRIRRRICRTQAEWDSLQANDNDGLGR